MDQGGLIDGAGNTPDGAAAQPQDGGNIDVLCMACAGPDCDFKPVQLQRRPVGPHDVLIKMKYCGVCHSDLHFAAGHIPNYAMPASYDPGCVPGHELAGVVEAVGSEVTTVGVGMQVGVGCLVDSCRTCSKCRNGEEQMCIRQAVGTYGSKVATTPSQRNKQGRSATPCGYTLGGYTSKMVVDEHFAIRIPDGYPLEAAGPVMCAGITMYDPLVKLNAGAGTRVGVAGLGGLGQLGIKIAKAMGCTVTVISRSEAKRAHAISCGADAYIASSSVDDLVAAAGSLDIILNTIPCYHDYDQYTNLIAAGGKQVLLGLHKGLPAGLVANGMSCGISKVTGSGIGGIANTQAVIDLCAEHNIVPELKVLPVEKLNQIFRDLDSGNDQGIRFVLDIEGSLNDEATGRCTDSPANPNAPEVPLTTCGVIGELCRLICCCKCR